MLAQVSSKIQSQFSDGAKLSSRKLSQFQQKLKLRRQEIATMIRAQEMAGKKSADLDVKAKEKIEKKVLKEDLIRALDEAIATLDTIVANASAQTKLTSESQQILARAILIDQATQVQGRDRDLPRILRQLKNIFKDWDFQLDEKIATQELHPDSLFIGPMIGAREMPQSGLVFGANSVLYADAGVEFPPADVVLEYKKFRASQTKPKFDAIYVNGKKEHEFKVKLTLETHSEITAAALATSLGYYTDLSKHYASVRVRFKSAKEWDSFLRDWKQYYRDFSPEKSILKTPQGALTRKNQDGTLEVQFQRAILEAKDIKDMRRLGAWDWSQPEVQDDLAARAILLFNIWVGNPDILPENTKVLESESGKFHYMIHDFGLSFASLFAETINTYNEDLVSRIGNSLHFKFFSWQDRAAFRHVSGEDLKWMARRIAGLSRTQIVAAVELGEWPAPVAQYLTEKLVARRNQLVEAFSLQNEFALLPANPKLSTVDGAIVNGEMKQFFYATYPERLGQSISSMIGEHIGKPLKDAAIDGVSALLGSIERIPGENQNFWNPHFLVNVRVNSQRAIERNAKAETSKDVYLVRDDATIGFELGADFIIGGSGAALWKYTMIYPEKDYQSARNHGGFWLSLKSPSDLDYSQIPESAVLIVEKQIEGTGFLRTDRITGYFPIGLQVGVSKIPLKRLIVSRKNPGKVEFFLDHGTAGAVGAKLYANLGILKFPFATAKKRRTLTTRESYSISEVELRKDPGLLSELNGILKSADSVDCQRLCAKAMATPALENFSTSLNSGYDFGFYSKKTISQDERTTNLKNQVTEFDFTRDREKKWSFLDDGEKFKLLIRARSGEKKLIHLHFQIDDQDASSPEVDDKYMRFLQGAFYQSLPIMHASVHSSNGKWGGTLMLANMVLDERAINALSKIDIAEFESFATNQFPRFDLFGLFGSDYNHRAHARDVVTYLQKLKGPLRPEARVWAATEVLNRSILCVDGTWSADLLGWIMSKVDVMTGGKGFYYNANFGPAPFKENTFPAGKPWFVKKGEPIGDVEAAFAQISDESPVNAYAKF